MAVSAFPSDTYRGSREAAEINITPLVDVLLVLLVIFMVTAPALTQRLDLQLPQPSPDVRSEPPPRPLLIVQASGGYLLEGAPLSKQELPAALQALARREPRAQLQIQTSEDADYQGFAQALAAARRSGLNDLILQ